jgi:hypothetical protein
MQYSWNLSNLSQLYQKVNYSFGIKVFNNLPPSLKSLIDNIKQFKSVLKNYLHAHSFYSVDESSNVSREC